MSLATVTVTVLPVFLAQASVAALTALVSASPDDAMSIVSPTGPLAEAGALEAAGVLLEPSSAAGAEGEGSGQGQGQGVVRMVRVIGDSFVGVVGARGGRVAVRPGCCGRW